MESHGIEQWYPRYWSEWEMQSMQWTSPYGYGLLWMFDWENPSKEQPLEFHGLEELFAPTENSGGWGAFQRKFTIPT